MDRFQQLRAGAGEALGAKYLASNYCGTEHGKARRARNEASRVGIENTRELQVMAVALMLISQESIQPPGVLANYLPARRFRHPA